MVGVRVDGFLALPTGEARKRGGDDGGQRVLWKGTSPLSQQVFEQRQDGR